MTIVFLNTTGVLGGAERCLLDVVEALRAARPGWRSRVVLGEDGPLRAALGRLDVPAEVVPLPEAVAALGDAGLRDRRGGLRLAARGPTAALATTGYLARLRRALRGARPDRVQTNGMKAHVLGAWAAPRGVPVVWHLHDYLGDRAVMSRLLRLAGRRRGVSAVAVSRSVADDARRVLGPGLPVRAIHNAVDLDRFAPGPGDGAALDAASGLPPSPTGTVRVGLVATFARWKGHAVFLDAVARLAPGGPFRSYIVGGPIYRTGGSQWSFDELRDRAEALGLGDRVGFAGHQPDPAAALRGLDVVVHASTRPEPFGRVIVEGMACGRAVIAAPLGGAAELFADGVDALASPPGDPDALAAAISRLALDPGLRRRLGDTGRATAVARFDARRLGEPWARVHEGRETARS